MHRKSEPEASKTPPSRECPYLVLSPGLPLRCPDDEHLDTVPPKRTVLCLELIGFHTTVPDMLPSWLPLALQLHASPLSLPLVSPPLLPQPWLRTAVYNPKQIGKVWYRNPLYQENLLTCALCRYYEGLSAASARILGQVNQLVGGLLPKKSGQQLSLRRVYLYSGRLHHWFYWPGLRVSCCCEFTT